MVKCEMYEANKTFYEKEGKVLCPIKRGTCPYTNEGHRLKGTDGIVRIICKTNAEVAKTGLIKNLQD